MNPLPLPLLTRQRYQQTNVMFDSGRVLVYSATAVDAHNRPVPTYTAQDAISCGVNQTANLEATDTEGNVILVDYQIRLPHETIITGLDRFEILTRYGQVHTAVTCEIIGLPKYGQTAVVIDCKVLTHG